MAPNFLSFRPFKVKLFTFSKRQFYQRVMIELVFYNKIRKKMKCFLLLSNISTISCR